MAKWKNYGLWVAVAALFGMVLQDAGLAITPEKFNGYVDAILTVLVLAGIVSNPSVGKGFGDKDSGK
ncbi:holin [Cytobacillus gottheilii]|uniref:Holin n=1 Tax=Cytobacillus gottheilii TaxID=859144 RepID=A0ABX8FG43_9BACI|nr:holin [Cytobacillus gottheilii]QVY63003.1 holin [Cytobacillus gottheilii]